MGLQKNPAATRYLIILTVSLGSFTYGYAANIIATTLSQPSFLSFFDLENGENASSLKGAINGLFQAGGLIGTLVSCYFADSYGRRGALAVGSVVSVIGSALQAGSVHIAMYLLSRLVTGIGIGMLVTLVPLYQSECSPPKIRGLLVGMHGAFLAAGYAISSWVGVGFFYVDVRGAQWRLPLAIQGVPPLLLAVVVWLLPESPRWLLGQDSPDKAFAAFLACCVDQEQDIELVHDQFNILYAQIQHEKQSKASLIDMVRLPHLRRRCALGFYTMIMVQGTATLVITNYAGIIYSSLGFGAIEQLLLQAGYVTLCFFGNLFNALVVDSLGRKNILAIGLGGVITALIGEIISVSSFQRTGNLGAAKAAVFFIYWHVACFSSTCDGTSYIFASEIFPTPVRARGLSISISGLFLSTTIFLSVAPTAFAEVSWKFYLYFLAFSTVSLIIVILYFPEVLFLDQCVFVGHRADMAEQTKGKSMEEIAETFGDTVEHSGIEEVKSTSYEHVEHRY